MCVTGLVAAHGGGKIASVISVESGHSIGTSLAVLRMYYRWVAACPRHVPRVLYRLGARSLTLTHNCNNPWADASLVDQEKFQPVHNGLTDFGKVRATRVTAALQCTKRINFEIENEDVILPFYIEKLRNFVKVLLGTIP